MLDIETVTITSHLGDASMALPRLLKTPFRPLPSSTAEAFDRWLNSPAGMALLDAERALLGEILPRMVGYTALQCAVGTPRRLLDISSIRQQVYLSASGVESVSLRARPCTFPLRKQSLDLVLLHHTLDFDDDPQQVLRNAARTLVPGGALVVVGFNPASVWGLTRFFRGGSALMPWKARFISAHRVGDWASVLGCEPEGLESSFHSPQQSRLGGWLSWLMGRLWSQHGSFYVMVARKRAAMIRPTPSRFSLTDRAPNVIPVSVGHWRGGCRDE